MFTMVTLSFFVCAAGVMITWYRFQKQMLAVLVLMFDYTIATVRSNPRVKRILDKLPKRKQNFQSATLVCNLQNPEISLVYQLHAPPFQGLCKIEWTDLLCSVVNSLGGCGDVIFEAKKTLFVEYAHPQGGRVFVRASTHNDNIDMQIPTYQMKYTDKVHSIEGDSESKQILNTLSMFAGPNYDFHGTKCTVGDLLLHCRLNNVIHKEMIDNFFVNGLCVTTRSGKKLTLSKERQLRDILCSDATIDQASDAGNSAGLCY